jgi:hypothetical protein
MSRKDITTVHLGQYTRESANTIAGELEEAGIVWWYKEPGWLSSLWEHGVRLFVDKARVAEAKEIARRVVDERASGPPSEPGPDPLPGT